MRVHLPKISRRLKHQFKWGLIHVSLLMFACDLVGALWPSFAVWWSAREHLGVALAAVLATVAEYIHEDENKESEK